VTGALATSPNGGLPPWRKKPGAADEEVSKATGHAAAILFVAPDGDVLLCRRSPEETNYGGFWALPGGKAEEGEDPESAAVREVKEELGAEDGVFGSLRRRLLDRRITPTGMAFHTFVQSVPTKFQPRLNDEHVGYSWFPIDGLPSPLHPGVAETFADTFGEEGEGGEEGGGEGASDMKPTFLAWSRDEAIDVGAADTALALALDKDSVRTFDKDRRMHVEIANISKANVCPYRGREIPGWAKLGLDPERIYNMLRDPEELKRATPTFNRLPILRLHKPVSAEDHSPYDIIGTTGSDAAFDGTYLTNSLAIWAAPSIRGIEDESKRELSSGYHYTPDMTPGNFDGKAFDGVMRDIHGNHVTLVEDGRAGPDVVVGDSRENLMTTAKATRLGALALALTGASVAPLLAMDAKLVLPKELFGSINTSNFGTKKGDIVAAVRAGLAGKTRKGMAFDEGGLAKLLDALEGTSKGADESVSEEQHNAMAAAAEGNSNLGIPATVGKEFLDADKGKTFDAAPLLDFLKGKGMDDATLGEVAGMLPKKPVGLDEDPEEKKKREEQELKDKEKSQAQDAAMMKDMVKKSDMTLAIDSALKGERDRQQGIREALHEVRPWVGDLPTSIAFDDGAGVRRHALKMLGVANHEKLHADALPAILAAQQKPGARQNETVNLGMDDAAASAFEKRFPEAARIRAG
jgi:8-oxo-dGTP pyrophosphatase MutT (NUDIX family)